MKKLFVFSLIVLLMGCARIRISHDGKDVSGNPEKVMFFEVYRVSSGDLERVERLGPYDYPKGTPLIIVAEVRGSGVYRMLVIDAAGNASVLSEPVELD